MPEPLNILVMNRQYHQVFGGVEYMSTSLANEMVSRGHHCHLLSLDREGAEIQYDINSTIQWHKVSNIPASKPATWSERIKRLKRIREILVKNNIDVAIGFQDGAYLSLALAALGTNIPVIAAERNAPTRFDFTSEGKYKDLRYQSFRLARAITVQCPSYIKQYPAYLRDKMHVIPNPVFPAPAQATPGEDNNQGDILLSVGRLSYQKNFECLIEAFSRITHQFPNWTLVVVGEGEERQTLEKFIQEKNLGQKIQLVGYHKDLSEFYQSAHLFCLPSRWEGFPNALAEAMSYGLPSVGFMECAGVSDLIEDQISGRLAPGNADPETLANTLSLLMTDSDHRKILGQAALKKCEEFAPSTVYDMWENLFYRMINKKMQKAEC